MSNKYKFLPLLAVAYLSFSSCHSFFGSDKKNGSAEQLKHHSAYDDSTLNRKVLPVMMPYNRIIQPAGELITYGSPELENHSLDLKQIPGTNLIAIEDRYGIAIIDKDQKKLVSRWTYPNDNAYRGMMSTYSGIEVAQINGQVRIFWSAASGDIGKSIVLDAIWDGNKISIKDTFTFTPEAPAPLALPNEVAVNQENGKYYLYVVLNGNNTLVKTDIATKTTVWAAPTGVAPYGLTIVNGKAFVTNWGGDMPSDKSKAEVAGVPYGKVYTDPVTGATREGSVAVFNLADGKQIKSIPVGLHPNDIIASHSGNNLYVANSNSDAVSVINVASLKKTEDISVKINAGKQGFIGDSPNALAISPNDETLYVANGMDNAVAVINLGKQGVKSNVSGYIPTEAYPGGLAIDEGHLFVANLEGEGARVNTKEMKGGKGEATDFPDDAYNSHHQKATVSIINLPDAATLANYTNKVKDLMLNFRTELARLTPRPNQPARPMPERIGEPSVFRHVIYIIKENRTYDQVLGDLPLGNGRKELCVFGDSVTPNQHQLARSFVTLDNYYASGKCSAEGHQWTDAGMVTDYIEKNVRAWFRSYPHVQTDAMVYSKKGFIWNNAADHGKSVRIFGEASLPNIDTKLTWTDIYNNYKAGKPLIFTNVSTIARVRPMLSQTYPASDYLKITDQIRADAFIKELKEIENKPGDQFYNLSVMALSTDHTTGTRPGMPTPRAMVADNDLAVGRIIEAVSKSRFWKNTVIFVTEDDSQAGWDHVSAYRTTGFVVSPYSRMQRAVSVNYNQTCMVRSIEQILGIPPMNLMDATALPMFSCFDNKPSSYVYTAVSNKIKLDEMNPTLSSLKGKDRYYAQQSLRPEYNHVDGGNDDVLNRILWHYSKKGKEYPKKFAGKADLVDDDD
ncbi:bifunctional YncE family protein/alkaline phosphatase family protein [Mucilaginibacter sp. KACC 22063]|uniref:bifunctional YncE family protein/alkaline phosphatase family protein n=1 Tax=Mucilaginibacter sp. KACC 22063 TaxID=3025666 RepID=UPI002365FCD5|nr:bifunctional YncE family protein/alkaline phosphatase family protein [Mucilaginibacter sp. KACC 22063]WDF56020.1 bifunctional YncE family protein/alkaline phosphatase family protein [Mucilaginibacter sp. KACC 22063]